MSEDRILKVLTAQPGTWLSRAMIADALERPGKQLQAYENTLLKLMAERGEVEERQIPEQRNRFEYRVKGE